MSPFETLIDAIVSPIPDLHLNPVMRLLQPQDPSTVIPARRISGQEDPAKEVIDKRTLISKTYRIGPDTYKIFTSAVFIHYEANGRMEEVNLKIEDVGGKKVMAKAHYNIELFTDRVGYHLKMPDGTNFIIELVEIAGFPVDNTRLRPTVKDCQIFYDGLALDASIKILLRPDKPEIYTRLASPRAPRAFTWKIMQHGNFEFKSFGADAKRDAMEIIVDTKSVNENCFLYTETWTGRISRKEKKTRIKRWHDDPVYPVVIDPTVAITQEIVTHNDNGMSYGNGTPPTFHYFFASWIGFYNWLSAAWLERGYPAFRFQKVGVPHGATIVSAKLNFTLKRHYAGATFSAKFFGNKVGNAAAWSNASLPAQMVKTTGASWTPPAFVSLNASSPTSVDVTNQVASIVGLGSWASNNAMRFAGMSIPQNNFVSGADLFTFWSTASLPVTGKMPYLVIVYTVAANPRLGDMNTMAT